MRIKGPNPLRMLSFKSHNHSVYLLPVLRPCIRVQGREVSETLKHRFHQVAVKKLLFRQLGVSVTQWIDWCEQVRRKGINFLCNGGLVGCWRDFMVYSDLMRDGEQWACGRAACEFHSLLVSSAIVSILLLWQISCIFSFAGITFVPLCFYIADWNSLVKRSPRDETLVGIWVKIGFLVAKGGFSNIIRDHFGFSIKIPLPLSEGSINSLGSDSLSKTIWTALLGFSALT